MLEYDVVVMGGGPAGAAAALAARGRPAHPAGGKAGHARPTCSGFLFTKPCSSSRVFREMPEEVAAPSEIKGVRLYLPRDLPWKYVSPDATSGATASMHGCARRPAPSCGTHHPTDFAEWRDRVEVRCLRGGEPVGCARDAGCRGRQLLEDSAPSILLPSSPLRQPSGLVARSRGPGARIPERLRPRGTRFYPAAYLKDDLLVMDHSVAAGTPIGPTRARFMDYVRVHHGLELIEPVYSLGCRAVFAAAYNRFCLGTGRVLLAGEAAGFQDVMGGDLLRSGHRLPGGKSGGGE